MAKKDQAKGGVQKRQKIKDNSRVMFFWVAGASIVVSFAIVVSIFLFKQIFFNEKVLMKKGDTVSVLKKDIESAKELHRSVDELRADKSLGQARTSTSKNNLDVILDALPYEGDSISLGSSLQTTLLNGVSLDSLTVDSIDKGDGVTGATTTSTSSVDTSGLTAIGDSQVIGFTFKVTGTDAELKNLFERLNRSIRPIKIITAQLQSSGGGKINVTAQAVTYYQPNRVFELKETTIKP